MGTIAEQLQDKIDAKDAIKLSIENKGVSVDDELLLNQYAARVDLISTEVGADIFTQIRNGDKMTIEPVDDLTIMTEMDRDYLMTNQLHLTSFENDFFSNSDTSNYCLQYSDELTYFKGAISATGASYGLRAMFSFCTKLEYFESDLSGLVNNYILSSRNFFQNCSSLLTIRITGISDVLTFGYNSVNCFFGNAVAVENMEFTCEITTDLYLVYNTSLNFDSILNILTQLYDYSSGSPRIVSFDITIADVGGQLAAAVLDANSKNWTVAGLIIT